MGKVIFGSLVFLAAAVGLRNSVYAAGTSDIENLVRQYEQDTKCKNVSVVVYENGDEAYFGDSEALYQIGSMTKAFTGLAAQKLIYEGLIDENGFVSDYIPGFEAYFDHAKVDITVEDLLLQKSGYTNSEKDYPSASESMTLTEWAKSISGRELKSMPGTEYAYSNVNFNLLGLIIENVSGMSYRDYMEWEILAPLGLENTSVGVSSGGKIVEGTRLGYRMVRDFHLGVREASIPAGYFYSNAADMGRWIGIWTGSVDVPEDLREPLAKVKESLKEEGDYYSGWELFSGGVIGHSGGTPNYSSRIVFDENRHIGVCVLTNLNVAATTDSLCNSIYSAVSGGDSKTLSADIWTIFDKVFTGVTLIGIILIVTVLAARKRTALIVIDAIVILIFALILILFPMIFGAGMREIMFTWAPWSLTGGLIAIACVIAAATVRIFTVRKNADHNKTGKGQTADGDNRIPGKK